MQFFLLKQILEGWDREAVLYEKGHIESELSRLRSTGWPRSDGLSKCNEVVGESHTNEFIHDRPKINISTDIHT